VSLPDLATYVKRRRTKGWTKPPGAVPCTRGWKSPGPWGNPFAVGDLVDGVGEVRDHDHAVALYADLFRRDQAKQRAALDQLAGKILMCWCAPNEVCHVQTVLIPFVNEGRLP
jgi:hypothetical protein